MGGGLVEGGSDFAAADLPLASRASLVNRLSFLNPSIASESMSIRVWRSSTAFMTPPLGQGLVRVEAVCDEECVEWVASTSAGGEVWTATDVERGECLYLVPCDTGSGLRKGFQR